MMIPTVAVIPTRYEEARLRALLDVVTPEATPIILDNGHEPPIRGDVVDTRGLGLYAQWNLGWRLAVERYGTVNIAVLNDDILIHPGTLTMMATALRQQRRIGCVYPDVRTGFARGLPSYIRLTAEWDPLGGRSMTGFCFMFKGELPLPPFDEGMEWWYGDSEFDESLKAAGYGVARVDHLPIIHVSDSETNDWARRPELREATERDGLRWAERHDHVVNGRWVPREVEVST